MTTFADVLGGPRTLTVKGLTFAYRPDAITPNSLRTILMAGDADDPVDSLEAYKQTIPVFLASWDLEDGGQPVPVTAEGVGVVPLAILDMVFEAIMDDRQARASEEGNASSASGGGRRSASTAQTSTGTRRNGSGSSTRPASIGVARGSS